MNISPRIESLLRSTSPLRARVAAHDVYESLKTAEQLRLFMEHHVFAVWDFMSLVKSLQGMLTCAQVPWLPQGDLVSRRLINEIVLDEESDDDGVGGYASHFELYLDAMVQCGADATRIRDFVDRLRRGEHVLAALDHSEAPAASRKFVAHTWRIISSKSPHQIAAAFAIGREEIVPEMFQAVVRNLQEGFPGQFSRFGYYLERHIHFDKDRHAPMAARMLEALCGNDETKWGEALHAAQTSLKARVDLWDDVKGMILSGRPSATAALR